MTSTVMTGRRTKISEMFTTPARLRAIFTLRPARGAAAPRTTTCSPLARPPSTITTMSPSVRGTSTLRTSAVMSALTT